MDKYKEIKSEIQKIGEKYISEIGADISKVTFRSNKKENYFDLRCGGISIFAVEINEASGCLEKIQIVDDTQKYKNGKSKSAKYPCADFSDIEKYSNLIKAHLQYILDKRCYI